MTRWMDTRDWRRQVRRTLRPAVRAALAHGPELAPDYWGLSVVGGRLQAAGVDLAGLGERFGSPLHVVLAERLRARARACRAPVDGAPVELFYSYKTNPLPGVLRLLHGEGIGAEVISPYELWLAERLGVAPAHIVYGGPGKDAPSIRRAVELGIHLLNVNHREELDLVEALAAAVGRRARVGLRVATAGSWNWQFGLSMQGGEALQAYRDALRSPHLEVVGLHAHRGALMHGATDVEGFVRPVLEFCDVLQRELGLRLELLDLGGSLAVPSVGEASYVEQRLGRAFQVPTRAPDPAATLSLPAHRELVSRLVAEHSAARGQPPPSVILEPGRALTADTQLLLCRVASIKAMREPPTYAILDAGIHVAEPVAHERHALFAATRHGEPATTLWRLVGPTCTPHDVLYSAWSGPALQPGDVLAIMDAGAYLIPFATNFSFPRPGAVLLDADAIELVRRAETFDDLVRRDASVLTGG